MTRTVKFGTPENQAQEIYDIVLKAETTAIKAIKPGVKLKAIDKIARDIISGGRLWRIFHIVWDMDLDLEEHEYQDVSSTNENVLEAGMVNNN